MVRAVFIEKLILYVEIYVEILLSCWITFLTQYFECFF